MRAANGGLPYRHTEDIKKAKAQALFFANEFFVGDSQNNTINRIDGTRTRLTGDQVLDAGSSDGGDELTLDMLDELLDQISSEAFVRLLYGRFDFFNEY